MTLSTQPRQRDKSLNVLEWPSQSPDLNPIEHLWRDLQQRSTSNLTEIERICREEWEKLPIVASYPRRRKAVIAAKVMSNGAEHICKCDI
jgi:hypothetical protein